MEAFSSCLLRTMVSIIAKFRTGRRVAQEQAQPSTKDQATPSASSTPYRHIPTHAAMDAMAGSPTCYREQDRQKIREQHRRRSARNVAAMSEKTSSVGATRPNSYAGYNTEQFYGRASTIDRAQSGQKTRMRPERYDSGIKRSPLSSVGMVDYLYSHVVAVANRAQRFPLTSVLLILPRRRSHRRRHLHQVSTWFSPLPQSLTNDQFKRSLSLGSLKSRSHPHYQTLARAKMLLR